MNFNRWAYFNYYNDDYYKQWWHQLFFTVTEMLSTVTIFYLVDKNNYASPRKILAIMRYVLILRPILLQWGSNSYTPIPKTSKCWTFTSLVFQYSFNFINSLVFKWHLNTSPNFNWQVF